MIINVYKVGSVDSYKEASEIIGAREESSGGRIEKETGVQELECSLGTHGHS